MYICGFVVTVTWKTVGCERHYAPPGTIFKARLLCKPKRAVTMSKTEAMELSRPEPCVKKSSQFDMLFVMESSSFDKSFQEVWYLMQPTVRSGGRGETARDC